MRIARRSLVLTLGGLLALSMALPASAKPAPVTKIRFKLDVHHITLGQSLTGTATVWTRDGHAWVPVEAAVLSVRLHGTEVATVTTDADGVAPISYTPTEVGGAALKVVFEGDDLHKRARRAQGFEVGESETPVTAPTAPVVTATSPITATIQLSWTAPADGGSAITGYNVYRSNVSGGEGAVPYASVSGSTTSFTDAGLTTGDTWYYTVTAVNAFGESVSSAEVSATVS
ncbi:MAG: fibronectin type III domain-containing protein [Candidatus Velamenicoccus archaeovorus]